jgi:hypothetical protein
VIENIPPSVIVITFMIILSLILNFISKAFLEILFTIFDNIIRKNQRLNSESTVQYDNSEEDNELDSAEITI